MKEKLEKVREALEVLQQNFDAATYLTHRLPGDTEIITNAQEALALLDSIISMLDTPWQPIETAPIDGTEIVIQDMYYDKNGNKNLGERYVAYYEPGEARWFDGSGTWIDVCPDYWMPLPAIKSIRDKDNG